MKDVIKYAWIDALATSLYIVLIVSFIYSLGNFFPGPDKKTILIPVAMLMLFVFSAAFTGFLVFGRPIMFYLDNKKKEALILMGYTLGILFIITIIAFIMLFLFL